MFAFRRIVVAALEDFGLRRPTRDDERTGPIAVDAAAPVPLLPAIVELPPGVVWHGVAPRRPELQRFCDHLEGLREHVS